jgi:hypothetical protein
MWNTWSPFGVERHHQGKEQAPMMTEQARKIKNKAIPEWAEGLYYNKMT